MEMRTQLPPLLLLHGALGSRKQLSTLADMLRDIRETHCGARIAPGSGNDR